MKKKPTAKDKSELTFKQMRFVQELPLVNFNGAAAYRNAGYQVSTNNMAGREASRLLLNPRIQSAIAKEKAEIARRNELSQDWVVSKLRTNTERALQEVPAVDKDGKPTGVYTYEGSVANRALELLGKHIGMWEEKAMPARGDLIVTLNIGDKQIIVQREDEKRSPKLDISGRKT